MKSVNTAHEATIEKFGSSKDRLKVPLSDIEQTHKKSDHLEQAEPVESEDRKHEALRRLDRILAESGDWIRTYRNQPLILSSGILLIMENVKGLKSLGDMLKKVPRMQAGSELLSEFLKEKENERITRSQKVAGSQS